MKPLLTTTLIAALFIGCGKQDEAPPENKSGSKPANAAGGQAVSKLVEAAFNGDLKATQALIAEGADLNQKDPNGSTPLIIAALFGHTEVCQALMEGGADLDLTNKDGSTALMSAALLCHPETVKALLAKGADANMKNKDGTTARDTADLTWDKAKPIYEFLDGVLFKPLGKPIDFERIQKTRPEIAELLQEAATK